MKKSFPALVPKQAAPPQAARYSGWTTVALLALLLTILYLKYPGKDIWSLTGRHHAASTLERTDPVGDDRGSPSHASTDFSWDSVATLPYLSYTPCYTAEAAGGYQCARLELQMDYWNSSTHATISLAVIKKPAVIPVTDARYGGAVLLNPGGPGGSGVGFLLRAGKSIRETIDSVDNENGLFYDLISFDPRGVGLSEPAIRCVNDPQLDRSWQIREMEEGVFESSDAALGRLWSMSVARGLSCSLPQVDQGAGDIREFVSTASVARDMLEIVERHGEWRQRETEGIVQAAAAAATQTKAQSESLLQRLRHRPGEEKIQYWGFSYGTYLGNTFAAMFPDRVHRIVVDGVVDAYNYRQTLWSDNLLDTEKALDTFYHHCARVGHPACALANETGPTTAEGVRQRVANITTSLYHNPLPVISPNPEIITYSDIRNLIGTSLYTPIPSFPHMANVLAAVERGNATAFADLLRSYHTYSCPSNNQTTSTRNHSNNDASLSHDATMAIACTDGEDQSTLTQPTFAAYARALAHTSPSIGSIWSTHRLHCIHYRVRARHRFQNAWEANTSHPILLIGNTADPVTPGVFAHTMARGFRGAVALTQDSAGHCSTSAHSACTVGFVRRYFQTGELPPVNTTCEADEVPFGDGRGGDEVGVSEAKRRTRRMNRALHEVGGGFMRLGMLGKMRDAWFD